MRDTVLFVITFALISIHFGSLVCDDVNLPVIEVKAANESVRRFTNRLFHHYLTDHRPYNPAKPDDPTFVTVDLYINSFGYVSIRDMNFNADIILRQRWNDVRLRYGGYNQKLVYSGRKDFIWTSDLFFRNALSSHRHSVTKPNVLIWIQPSGDILYSQKLSLTSSCIMDLTYFPMDHQMCYIEIGSYAYSMADLQFIWKSDTDPNVSVQLNENINMNEFHYPKVQIEYCAKNYSSTGAFTCIKVGFLFHRKFGSYLLYTYMPTIFIVGISWLSFFIDFTVTPARVTLGLLSLLTLMTQSASTIAQMPRVSYIKSMDIWIFTCLAFVVTALLEFAVVNCTCKPRDGEQVKKSDGDSFENESLTDNNSGAIFKIMVLMKTSFNKEVGHKIDRAFMIGFPIVFGFFNIIYWTLSISS